MTFKGAVPPDFRSPTGQFRLQANDLNYTPTTPGFGEYELFSDDEINGYLTQTNSILRAVGFGYLGLAGRAALESKTVKDYDLSADLTKRAADLRSQARALFEQADAEADRQGFDSFFDLDQPDRERHRWLEPTERDVLGWGLF